MDNVCHTLAGAALGQTGMKRGTRFGTLTLAIASNLPDIDVLVWATEIPHVAFRRGWTHGVLAQALLPIVLAVIVFGLGRRSGARFGRLLFLSYVGVISHVGMDLLNNYGVRLLMPFSGRWFYGDSAFIIDPWLWFALGAAVWLARSPDRLRAARGALAAAALYVAVLVLSSRAARAIVAEGWQASHGSSPRALMVGPVPVNPLRRAVIVDAGDAYATGTFSWLSRRVEYDDRIAKNHTHPAVAAAIVAEPRFRAVLTWTRFPCYAIETTDAGYVVTLRDVRFWDRVGAVRTIVPRAR